jgi:two-component system sensor histidine kinase PilS (NtrC family)
VCCQGKNVFAVKIIATNIISNPMKPETSSETVIGQTSENLLVSRAAPDLRRSFLYFNFYRLILSSLLVLLAGVFGEDLSLDPKYWELFLGTSAVYLLAVIAAFVTQRLKWPSFAGQLVFMIGADIVCLTVLAHASGGIQSNVSLLLMVSLASAGMISRGKITLFFASLASIAALLEHSYAVLYGGSDTAQYIQVGLLCIGYFAVAWLAHTLAKYAMDSQKLAQLRGRKLVSLSEANRMVMHDMQDGVLVVDGEGKIMQMNQCAERLLRKSARSADPLAEHFPLLFHQYKKWKDTGRLSNDTLWLDSGVLAKLRCVAIEGDVTRGTLIFLEDMQRVREEAQQIKLAALGRLTANIAHEVRNPLSAISYATEMLIEEQGDSKQQRLLQIVMDNTQRINQIVLDVMQLNRRDRAQIERMGLHSILNDFVEEFCMTEHIGRDVIILTGDADIKILFDRGHWRQILWNLCRNALRFSTQQSGSVNLKIRSERGHVVLEVQDDGPGVAAEQQGKLFEPFFTTATNGTGLGLYIAKELCEANGARLDYRDAVDAQEGACFRITFEINENGGV